MLARENPFAAQRLEALRFRFGQSDMESLLARFENLNRRGAIVGPHGSGKSTLLEQFAVRLAEEGIRTQLERLYTESGSQEKDAVIRRALVARDVVVLVDGAEQLGWLRWRRLLTASRNASGLVATMHKPGRLPTLIQTTTTPELLTDLVAELTKAEPERKVIAQLFEGHRGNLREALRDLYDRASR